MKNKTKTLFTIYFALIVWFALILQFGLTINKGLEVGRSVLDSFILVISFYTIQTNLLLAVALTSLLMPNTTWGKFFSRTPVLTAIAVYILIVGLVYNFVLRGLVKLEGGFVVADFLLHTLNPANYIFFWLVVVEHKPIQWRSLLPWACFPLAYLGYALLRGAVTGHYTYFFINAAEYGYPKVFLNSFFVLMVFLILGAIFISWNNYLSKRNTKTAANPL